MKDIILKINGLKKSYHDRKSEIVALEDINLEVNKKDFVSIVGPSGCGKSTILSILSLLEEKSGGEVELDNNVTIGYMLQDDSLFSWRTILDNCLIGLEIMGKLNEESKNYVLELLKTYGLYEFKDKYPSSLSGGMRQRVVWIQYRHKKNVLYYL